MVTVDYYGRVGNQLFQYSYARLLAQKNRLYLGTEAPKVFLTPTEFKTDGEKYDGKIPIEMIAVGDTNSYSALKWENIRRPIHCNGYFQDVRIYNEYRCDVRAMWDVPKIVNKNCEDLVIHLRLTDYWWHRNKAVISPAWYYGIIKKERYKKLFIVVEPHVTNERYLRQFYQFKPEIISQTPQKDFEFLRGFDRIVCSNSTFAWWAAFLSDATKVYTFAPWMKKNMNLAYMQGATVVDGGIMRDRRLESLDWEDYWNKDIR